MPFCASCGAPVEGRFCAKCGATVDAGAGAPAPQAPPPGAAPAAGAGLQDNVAATLCYVLGLVTGILFLVIAPYNQNKAIRFHAFQSIFFHVAAIAVWIAYTIVMMIMPAFIQIVLGVLSLVLWLGMLVIWVMLMIRAYQGQKWVLPIVGGMAEKQA